MFLWQHSVGSILLIAQSMALNLNSIVLTLVPPCSTVLKDVKEGSVYKKRGES